MKKYSILVVGIECYFGHVKEFVTNLKKKNPLVEITLITSPISDDDFNKLDGVANRIVQHKTYRGRIRPRYFVMLMNVLYYCFEFFGLLLRGHYDIVDIHFPNRHIKFAMPFLKMMTKNRLF